MYSIIKHKGENVKSYIGITDFLAFEQVEDMLKVFNKKPPNMMLHVGVMMSYKTLHGIPTKWQGVFPKNESIEEVFASKETYNCLHYADYDNNCFLPESLAKAINFGGKNIKSLQLDMIWPDPDEVAKGVELSCRDIEVILQIGANSLNEINNKLDILVLRLKSYQGIIHRVLLDKSMGRGLPMDASILTPFVRVIRENFPEFGIGVAGGLGPTTVELVKPIIEEFGDVSIDAQGRLRPSGNALDPINWEMAKTYLEKSIKLFS